MSKDGGGYWAMWIMWILPWILLGLGLIAFGIYIGSELL